MVAVAARLGLMVLVVLVALDFLLQQMELQPVVAVVVMAAVRQVVTLHLGLAAQVAITLVAQVGVLPVALVLLVAAAAAHREMAQQKRAAQVLIYLIPLAVLVGLVDHPVVQQLELQA